MKLYVIDLRLQIELTVDMFDLNFNETAINPPAELGRLPDA